MYDTYAQILCDQRCKRRLLDRQSGICSTSTIEGQGMGEERGEGQEGEESESTETCDDRGESITGVDRG